ncbi:MAG TPA: metal ABC transporter ATP-binding protein [Syntrophomonadaceae bacterium]|nr:metal ABC transporter ATP-binding protein [Syntrophomonadaceae bacterium]HNX29744.1 metal ABC transporter ATP-binding protein [Syntrophomonadaceae bacterium]HPR94218.1 metal ABC transporter ATP-binding protein [Syntrophomonadaceae bacterium]
MINDFRHNCKAGDTCSGLCCTKIENFAVSIGKTKILENVTVHIHCGELTAIIGPNGAGKTTLLRAILGEVKHSGELKYTDAKGVRSGNPIIGYVPQHLDFDLGSPTSVFDVFMASRTNLPVWLLKPGKIRQQVIANLTRVKAEHLIDRRLGALSGGELQRVLLALALDPIPDLLLLDEPVAGIDHNGLELFYDTVSELRRNYDLSIILVSHDLDLVARYADRVVLMNGTVICSGSAREVFNDRRTAQIFGMSWYKSGIEIKLPAEEQRGDM